MKHRIRLTYSRSKGISILEILISLGILSIVMISAYPTVSLLFKQTDRLSGLQMCRSRLQSQMSHIKDRGMAAAIQDYNLDSKGLPIAPGTSKPLVVSQAGEWKVETSVLIQDGAFSEILKDYLENKSEYANARGRQIPVVGASGTTVVEDFNAEYKDFKLYQRVQPYNILNPADPNPVPSSCSVFSVKPYSINNSSGTGEAVASDGTTVAKFDPCTLNNIGFVVTLTGAFQQRVDESGSSFVEKTCELQSRFALPVDNEPELAQTQFSVGLVSGLDINSPYAYNFGVTPTYYMPQTIRAVSEGRPLCSAGNPAYETATFRIQVKDVAPGSVPFCKDESERWITQSWCGPDPRGRADPPPGTVNKWVPCAEVTACGQPHLSIKTDVQQKANGRRDYTFDVTYGTVGGRTMAGCNVKFAGGVLDVSGNFSEIKKTTSSGYSYFQPPKCWACYKKKRSWSSVLKGVVLAAASFVVPGVGPALLMAGTGMITGGLLCMAGVNSTISTVGAAVTGGVVGAVANKAAGGCSGGSSGGVGNSCEIKTGKRMVCTEVPRRYPPLTTTGASSEGYCDLSSEAPAVFTVPPVSLPYQSTVNPAGNRAFAGEEVIAYMKEIPNDINVQFVEPDNFSAVTGNMNFPKTSVFCEARKVCIGSGDKYSLQPLGVLTPEMAGEGEPECFVRLGGVRNTDPNGPVNCKDSISLGALAANGQVFTPAPQPTSFPHITTKPNVDSYKSWHWCPKSSGGTQQYPCFQLPKYKEDVEAYILWQKYELFNFYKPISEDQFAALPACEEPEFPAPDPVPAMEMCGSCGFH